MARVLSFLIRYFSNYYTLHRSDLAAQAAPLDPRLDPMGLLTFVFWICHNTPETLYIRNHLYNFCALSILLLYFTLLVYRATVFLSRGCTMFALKFFLQRNRSFGLISDILNFEMSDLIHSLQVFLCLPRPCPSTTKFVISFIALVLR